MGRKRTSDDRRRDHPVGPCVHCGKVLVIEGRGLCSNHFKNKAIREQYPVLRGRPDKNPEPTEAELDALIERRRATMPKR